LISGFGFSGKDFSGFFDWGIIFSFISGLGSFSGFSSFCGASGVDSMMVSGPAS
jgi:hypothetical protein